LGGQIEKLHTADWQVRQTKRLGWQHKRGRVGGAGRQARKVREVGMQAVRRQGTREEEQGWRASRQRNQEAEAGKKGLAGKTG
jgi:hypothetical protein